MNKYEIKNTICFDMINNLGFKEAIPTDET